MAKHIHLLMTTTETQPGAKNRRLRWHQFRLRTLFVVTTLVAVAFSAYLCWPELALDGYCPVTLAEQHRWTKGDWHWFAVYHGRLYRFAGTSERDRFAADPEKYSVVASCLDIVMAKDNSVMVAGKREHGCFYKGRVYLFADEGTLSKFAENPTEYAEWASEFQPSLSDLSRTAAASPSSPYSKTIGTKQENYFR